MTPRGAWALASCALILVGAGVAARLWFAPLRDSQTLVPAGSASPPGPSDLGPEELAGPAIKIPERLPDFSLKDLRGKLTPVSTWSGKSLVLNFWATWCAPCRREIPLLKTLAGEWTSKDVQVVGIAVDYADKVEDFADQYRIGYPILVGEQEALDVAARLGVSSPAFPFTVFTDRRGEVVALYVGELHRPQANLILEQVENLNKGRQPLTEAREKIASGLSQISDRSTAGS